MRAALRALIERWQDRAAVRAEHVLEPTRRRRFDRLPQRISSRRALRAERRLHPPDPAAIDAAIGRTWARNNRPHG
ncbi:MAG: hypothetical protein JWM73_2455 [Solirubrobacterales bacterium]|nr:hypothetical protein [Solirubrobacterales bacterium]